jgi:mRNA deadenylase 3'-5' endonuclease subunit Ccr4
MMIHSCFISFSTCLSLLLLLCAFPSCNSYGNIRLVSWNLLAQCYSHPRKYPWCDDQYLEWNYRSNLIRKQLSSFQADIICLQEMQVDLWPDFISSVSGYTGILQNVTAFHPVASAVLIKEGLDLEVLRVESRSRALIIVLSSPSSPSLTPLYLANVHLEAGGSHDENLIRYNQLKSLWKRLKYHCTLDHANLPEARIVLAGDFNILHTNPLHTFLSQGLLDPMLITKGKGKIPLPMVTAKLHDAYVATCTQQGSCQLGMTYAQGSVLDYIFTSNGVTVIDTLLLHPAAAFQEPQLWPSSLHPSDHLPIGAVLEWL